MKKNDEMTVPLSAMLAPMSDSWRRRYERMLGTTILGDHRRNPGVCKYPYFGSGDSASSSVYPWTRKWDNDGDSEMKEAEAKPLHSSWNDYESVERDEELVKSWGSILEKGQSVVENNKNGHKPNFGDLFIILKKAHSIPKPEDVYGRRDTMSKQVSQCLNSILDLVENGREVLGHLTDAMYDESKDGIELPALRKKLDAQGEKCNVHLEELVIVREILDEAIQWESRLTHVAKSGDGESSSSEDLHLPQQSLASAKELASEGRILSLRPSSLVLLEERIHGAYELRNRIRLWSKVRFICF